MGRGTEKVENHCSKNYFYPYNENFGSANVDLRSHTPYWDHYRCSTGKTLWHFLAYVRFGEQKVKSDAGAIQLARVVGTHIESEGA